MVLIDTPGFDDSRKSQADVLKDIADFLEQTYEKGRKLSGIIYMHRISDFRVGGIARENFRLFTKICGKDSMKNVSIVTTMWEDVLEELGARRERELASKTIFFKETLDQGARMCRFYNTSTSAMEIMNPFVANVPKALRIQVEIVVENKTIPQTEAGKELRTEKDRQEQKHQEALRKLRQEMTDTMARKDAAHEKEIEEIRTKLADLESNLAHIDGEIRKLLRDRPKQEVKKKKSLGTRLLEGLRLLRPDTVYVERRREGGGCLDDGVIEL